MLLLLLVVVVVIISVAVGEGMSVAASDDAGCSIEAATGVDEGNGVALVVPVETPETREVKIRYC